MFCQPYLGTPVSSLSHAPLREYENAAETLFINILTCEIVAEIEHRAGHTPGNSILSRHTKILKMMGRCPLLQGSKIVAAQL